MKSMLKNTLPNMWGIKMINDYNAKVLMMIAIIVCAVGGAWYLMERWIDKRQKKKKGKGK
jgi:uncharacterized membrane protein YqgA involved in biofilm formation